MDNEVEDTPMEQEDGAAMEAAEDRKRRLELGMEEYLERYFYQYRDPRMPGIVSLKQGLPAGNPTVEVAEGQEEDQQEQAESSSSDEDDTLQQDRRRSMLIARQLTLRSNLLRQVATLPLRPLDPAIPNASRALRDVLRRMNDVDALTHHLMENSRQQLRTRTSLLESSNDDLRNPGGRHHQDPQH